MAKIPLYQQGNLASSVVGTPGVDRSGLMISGDLMQATESMANQSLQSQREYTAVNQQATEQIAQARQYGLNSLAQGALSATHQIITHHHNALVDQYHAQVAQRIQDTAAEQQQKGIDELNASMHINGWSRGAVGLAQGIKQDPQIPPDQQPEKVLDALNGNRDQYMKDHYMTDGERNIFLQHTDNHLTTLYDGFYKNWQSEATKRALSAIEVGDDQWAKQTETTDDLAFMRSAISDPQMKLYRHNAYGENIDKADAVLLQKAELNVAHTMARNPTLIGRVDGKPTTSLEEARGQGVFNSIDANTWTGITKDAHMVIKGQLAEEAKKGLIGQANVMRDAATAIAAVSLLKDSPQYGKALSDTSRNLKDMLAQQMQLPVQNEKSPTYDNNGQHIQYQNTKVIKALTAASDNVEGRMSAFQNDSRKEYNDFLKGETAKYAQTQAGYANTVAGAQTELKQTLASQPAIDTRARLTDAIEHLKNLGIPSPESFKAQGPSKAAQAIAGYTAGNDELQNYLHATIALSDAVHSGYIEPKVAAKIGDYLGFVGDRLAGAKKDDNNTQLLEIAHRRLISAAPQGITYLMHKYAGVSADHTNRELLSRTIDMYHAFKQANGGIEATAGTIDKLRTKAQDDMLKYHVNKPMFIPPPPAIPVIQYVPQEPAEASPTQDTAAAEETF